MTKQKTNTTKTFGSNIKDIKFDVEKDGIGVSFRPGRQELLDYLFKKVDSRLRSLGDSVTLLYGQVSINRSQK